MPTVARRISVIVCCVVVFLCMLPLSYRHLADLMYWTSLMSWPGYDPLLFRFPIFFDTHDLWTPALVVGIAGVGGLAMLLRDDGFRRVILIVASPIFAALGVQYAAITRLDDHVFWFFRSGIIRGLPWFFDGSALLRCLVIAIIYSIVAVALVFATRLLKATKSPNQAMERIPRPRDRSSCSR
jgi:hypothetical protein